MFFPEQLLVLYKSEIVYLIAGLIATAPKNSPKSYIKISTSIGVLGKQTSSLPDFSIKITPWNNTPQMGGLTCLSRHAKSHVWDSFFLFSLTSCNGALRGLRKNSKYSPPYNTQLRASGQHLRYKD